MTGTQTYDEHLANMRRIFEANFGPVPPAETKRSVGLDPQSGLIVGLQPDVHELVRLANAAADLPPVWGRYNTGNLHLTLGDHVDRDHPTPTDSLLDRFEQLKQVAGTPRGMHLKPGLLTEARLGISGDTIVLYGVPDDATFDLRMLLTGLAEPIGLKAGWSSGHITLARLTRPLTPEESIVTTNWLRTARVPQEVPLTSVIAGIFAVNSDSFGFVRTIVASLDQ